MSREPTSQSNRASGEPSRTDRLHADHPQDQPLENEPIRAIRYRHQAYRSAPPILPYQLLRPGPPTDVSSDDLFMRLRKPGVLLGDAHVVAVFVTHGTFAGTDSLGLLTELSRFAPSLARSIGRCGKRLFDWMAGETGNYTREYAATMGKGIREGTGRSIQVHRFHWSGQNSHIGRADAAIRLIDRLARLAVELDCSHWDDPLPPRVLLWGHSHSGNVFAIASHLLASMRRFGQPPAGSFRDPFFDTAGCFFRRTLSGRIDMPHWPRVLQVIEDAQHPLRRLAVDVVTFGTPIRYGWDADGYGNLLHFIHHRPLADRPEYLGPSSIHPWRILTSADGDAVHQFGIAGTNTLFNPFALRTLAADWRLHRLLQHNLPGEWFVPRALRGRRIPEAGTTLLVDYPDRDRALLPRLLGHAVYTRSQWLPFHLEEVARRFYGP